MKDPFRTAAVIEPSKTPKQLNRVTCWLRNNLPETTVFGGFVLGLVGILGAIVHYDSQATRRHEERWANAPCESFASTSMNEMPARCVGYWTKRQAGE